MKRKSHPRARRTTTMDKLLGIKGASAEPSGGTASNPWSVDVTNTQDFASALSSLFSGKGGFGVSPQYD